MYLIWVFIADGNSDERVQVTTRNKTISLISASNEGHSWLYDGNIKEGYYEGDEFCSYTGTIEEESDLLLLDADRCGDPIDVSLKQIDISQLDNMSRELLKQFGIPISSESNLRSCRIMYEDELRIVVGICRSKKQ